MTRPKSDQPRHSRRTATRVGVTAGALLVAILVFAGCGSDDANEADDGGDSAGSAVTTTSIPEGASGDAIKAVVSALDAKNSFDLDRWLTAFEGGERQGVPLFAEEILMNANQHWEILEPCQVTGETSSGQTVVECVISNTDDFWGAGGIFGTRNQRFTVDTDGLLTSTNTFSSDSRDRFNRAFHQWLRDSYPDVYAEMDPGFLSSNGPGFDAQDSGHMLVAVEYVEEFVAQSDTYPLDPIDQ